MEYLSKNIRYLRKTNRIGQDKLAEILKRSQPTIQQWETGKRKPDIGMAKDIADLFKVDINALLTIDLSEETNTNKENIFYLNIPLYSAISCGGGAFVEDNIEEYIQISNRLLNPNMQYFAQVADGDSMIEENIKSGDVLVFEKTPNIENGQVGCFCIDDNVATCKKFYKDASNNIIMLQPANSNYSPIVVTVENMGFHAVGKLSLVINKRD